MAQQLSITNRPAVTMLDETTAKRLRLFHTLECLDERGCRIRHTDGGLRAKDPPIIPRAPFERHRIYTASRQAGSWNIDSQLAEFNGRYYYGFTNGQIDEDTQGQRVRIARSEDACNWSDAKSVIGGEEDSREAYKCVGLQATDDVLYMWIRWAQRVRDPKSDEVGGGYYADWHAARTYLYRSSDGATWSKAAELPERVSATYEAPRLTADGRFLGVASVDRRSTPCMLLWPGDDPNAGDHSGRATDRDQIRRWRDELVSN